MLDQHKIKAANPIISAASSPSCFFHFITCLSNIPATHTPRTGAAGTFNARGARGAAAGVTDEVSLLLVER